MVKLLLAILLYFTHVLVVIAGNSDVPATQAASEDSLVYYSEKLNVLIAQIRDGKIEKQSARKEISILLPQLKRVYKKQAGINKSTHKVFPIAGYSAKAIGGTKGEGYQPGRYDFYDGNLHTGHPAHDIFIRDKDQNSLDDKTGKHVNILSLCKGIVVATQPAWKNTSKLRGGIYVVVYNPEEELLYYYAHNSKLFATPGTLVKAGDKLAELGRTGLNAYKQRSPTHLHLMALQIKAGGVLIPINLYPVLISMK
jgi:hypothetical protein